MKNRIPVFKPCLDDNEVLASRDALKLGWLGPGSYVKEFEEKIANLIGVYSDKVVAVNTGTSAVHLALSLLNINSGDEVITPSFNNIADFQCIHYLGAHPVFCDVKEENLTIDPKKIESLITEKTKAIISLDYGSALHDYDEVRAIAKKFDIPVLYDACHSFGSQGSNGNMIGSQAEFCVFSFDPVKNITCIDGGAIVVSDVKKAHKLRHMRQLGQMQSQEKLYSNDRSFTYDVEGIGYRYHLANLHAAIGIEQLKKLEYMKRKRQEIYNQYCEKICNEHIMLPPLIDDKIFPFIFVVRVTRNRDSFIDYCRENEIDTGIHWQPGHGFSFFKECRAGDLSVTNKIAKEIVTLPMYPGLTDAQINRVIDVVNGFKG